PEGEPSLRGAVCSRLGGQVAPLRGGGCRVSHRRGGGGHFTRRITPGPVVLEWIAPLVHEAGAVLDCHLMVESPEKHFEQFREAGADSVTVHFETCPDLNRVVGLAREQGLQVGLAFNPETEVDAAGASAVHAGVDIVLCMSIHPGYSGQPFMPESIERIRRLRELLPDSVAIQVDGGVGPKNIADLFEAGARLFVAATSVFGSDDPARAYRSLADAVA